MSASQPFTEYFSGLADDYAKHRPTYPLAAMQAVIEHLDRPIVVADVGCGTGISSRLLAEAGADQVIGIEPNDDMRAEAEAKPSALADRISYRKAAAERTGLADASVAAVLCAQSFHWFDGPAALAEFHRIIRPGGRVGLLWNVREDSDAATAAYGAIIDRAQNEAAASGRRGHHQYNADPTVTGRFTNARQLAFPHEQRLDLDGLLGRARSASYFPRVEPLKSELERALADIFAAYQRHGTIALRYRAELTLAERVDGRV